MGSAKRFRKSGIPAALACAAWLLPVSMANGQTGSSEADSLRHYELSEIVVGGGRQGEATPDVGVVHRVSLASLVRADAADVAGLARLIPSAHVQTNSRGESLVYLRAGGERQVAVFLDGALLNIPWDNRVDLSVLPSSVLGGVSVTQGAGSVLFGTNVSGGAVSLSTRSLERQGTLSEVTLAGGSGGYGRADVMHIANRPAGTMLVAGGVNRFGGTPMGRNVPESLSDDVDGWRINTDKRIAHGFLRLSRTLGPSRLGLSLLHVDAAKGVAPEGHLDPEADAVRYWRYPDWKTSLLTGNLSAEPGAWRFRATGWISAFRQSIEQYDSISFRSVSWQQEDRDDTAGLRVTLSRDAAGGTFRSALNGLLSKHRQVDTDLESGVRGPAQRYRQNTWSFGTEYIRGLGRRSRIVVGGNVDRFATPATFDKPGRSPETAWGLTTTLDVDLRSGLVLHSTVGRKVRFPTMRELFGTALNRFLVNDDLRPESAWLVDAGLTGSLGGTLWSVTGFMNRTFDTIDQTNVMVNSNRLRQRINLAGSRVLGVEVVGESRVASMLRVNYAATFMRPRLLGEPGREVLTEKPDVLVNVSATATSRMGGAFTVEAVYTGRAYGLAQDNQLTALPKVLQVHARAAVRRYTDNGVFGEFFARVDNVTDRATFHQLGLPGPGRTAQLGLSLSF